MPEYFGAGGGQFGGDGAGGDDARHLAVDDVGFFLFEQLGECAHAFQMGKGVVVKIDTVPCHARFYGVFDQGAV